MGAYVTYQYWDNSGNILYRFWSNGSVTDKNGNNVHHLFARAGRYTTQSNGTITSASGHILYKVSIDGTLCDAYNNVIYRPSNNNATIDVNSGEILYIVDGKPIKMQAVGYLNGYARKASLGVW